MRKFRNEVYIDAILDHVGFPGVKAIRALDAGRDPYTVWMELQEAQLSPLLAQALALARATGTVAADDLREVDPAASPSTLSNRLAELERKGLLVRQKEPELVKGGGRRFVYVSWDAAKPDSAKPAAARPQTPPRVPRPAPDVYEYNAKRGDFRRAPDMDAVGRKA